MSRVVGWFGNLTDEDRLRRVLVKTKLLILSDRHFAKALGTTTTEATSLRVFTRLHEKRQDQCSKDMLCMSVVVLRHHDGIL